MYRSKSEMYGRSLTFKKLGKKETVIIIFYCKAVWVHGWVYHVETGLIEDVILETSLPEEMKQAFELTFKKTE